MSNQEIQYKNVFCQQFHFHANETNFQMNSFARGLILKHGHKVTRKWPTGIAL